MTFDALQAHGDDGRVVDDGQILFAEQRAHAFNLVGLHVHEHKIGAVVAPRDGNLSEQGVLHNIERGDEKGAQAQREHENDGLVVWAVEIGQALSPHVLPG